MRWSLPLLVLSLIALPPVAHGAPTAKPRVHVVYSGQRLASIAKRYNVSVDALCTANGLSESDKIRPGQKLLIPPPSDKDGTRTRGNNPSLQKTERAAAPPPKPDQSDPPASLPAARVHKVESGQRLGSIAKRYGVTIEAICEANGIKRDSTLKPGQLLTLPSAEQKAADAGVSGTPKPSAKAARRAGYLELYTYSARWRGQVVDRKGKLSPSAVTGISRLLGATGDRPRLDQRLIRLLVQVSDAFGGRPIRVVSGYRTSSFYDDSRHRQSRAIDFSIPGVSNATLRDYLRRIPNVGVGYYPNSSFVHLDVREYAAYWVDYSGPGEAPRTRPNAPRGAVARAEPEPEPRDRHDHDHDHERERDDRNEAEANTATAGDEQSKPTRPASATANTSEPSSGPPLL